MHEMRRTSSSVSGKKRVGAALRGDSGAFGSIKYGAGFTGAAGAIVEILSMFRLGEQAGIEPAP